MVGSACFVLGVAAYWYTDGFAFPSAPPPLPPARTMRAVPSPAPQLDIPKVESVPVTDTARSEIDVKTVQNFATKQAALDDVKLDVAIAEQQAKLKELREGKPVPVVSHPVPQPISLPFLPPVEQSASTPAPIDFLETLPPVRRTTGLVTIQGVDGALSAVFATGNGKKTVRVGDTIMGSKVRAINLDGVTLSSGKMLSIGD